MRHSGIIFTSEVLVMQDSLQRAMQHAIAQHPNSSLQHRAAFANSVAYLVSGASGGFGGPSIREHLCSWSLAGVHGTIGAINIGEQAMTCIKPDGSLPKPGDWSFEDAIVHCEPLCFGDISPWRNRALQIQEREYCFDDDPEDLEALRGKSV
jgi:hypothetical protein